MSVLDGLEMLVKWSLFIVAKISRVRVISGTAVVIEPWGLYYHYYSIIME